MVRVKTGLGLGLGQLGPCTNGIQNSGQLETFGAKWTFTMFIYNEHCKCPLKNEHSTITSTLECWVRRGGQSVDPR